MTLRADAVLDAGGGVRGPDVDCEATITELVRAAYLAHADREAVRDGDEGITYAELGRRVRGQARALRQCGVRSGDVVVIEVPRSVAEVVAVLAVLEVGAAYLSVEPTAPPQRVAQMFAQVEPTAVVGTSARAHELAALVPSGPVPVVDTRPPTAQTDEPQPAGSHHGPGVDGAPGDTAYIAFTSGSTGAPKGVVIPHRGVVRLVRGATYLRTGPGERMSRLAPLAFDASTLEIFAPLATGAAIDILPPGPVAPLELAAFVAERGVTVVWITVGLFRVVVDEVPGAFDGVRQVLTGGDVVPVAQVKGVLERAEDLVLTIAYGPTECTTFATVVSLRDPAEVPATDVPMGTPVAGTSAWVLDGAMRPVPAGSDGELYLGGPGLTAGYLDAERVGGLVDPCVLHEGVRAFPTGDIVRWGSDGLLHFVGRKDRQLKIRGFRVEPAEVEALLLTHPRVRDAAVFGEVDGQGAKHLVAVVVGPDAQPVDQTVDHAVEPAVEQAVDQAVDQAVEHVADRPMGRPVAERGRGDDVRDLPAALRDDLRRLLSSALPDHMVPTRWALVSALPLTENGKVDYRSLSVRGASATSGHPVGSDGAADSGGSTGPVGASGAAAVAGPADAGSGTRSAVPDPRPETGADLESLIAGIWAEVLGTDDFDLDEGFFDVGGDSLSAASVHTRLTEALPEHGIRMVDLFRFPTIEQLAMHLRSVSP